MFDTHNHGEEISADTYATVMRHQFNLEKEVKQCEISLTIVVSIDRRDIASPAAFDINILTSVDIHSGLEQNLTSNTKLDTTACLGAWYIWDQILQTSLEGRIRTRLGEQPLRLDIGQKEVNMTWWQPPLTLDSWKPSLFIIFGASTRDDHRARPSVDIEEQISIDVHIRTSIDSEAHIKLVWSQPT
ncbi:hypothetical protein IGI04_035730 [Brassica rapa subsp. trilocularis]|uniref:Uncharacterized protein n=1 Tax=Brassica rapa subsp. trilocularis TaxID=1813537 RepID=A0ABQ7LEA5_BRACM|nr:hypothetical protein IGI04_035730 [Brassica rapa subsp. trilocularis]